MWVDVVGIDQSASQLFTDAALMLCVCSLHPFQRISLTVYGSSNKCLLKQKYIVLLQRDLRGAAIFFDPRDAACAGDGNKTLITAKHPG